VLGCAAFASAGSLLTLIAARGLIGAGVGACLMAALTCYRRVFSPAAQLRANSWMLMTGSLGMVASTVPVQALLPIVGWRGLFWASAVLLAAAAACIAVLVPRDAPPEAPASPASPSGYSAIVRHPVFMRAAPLAFFVYGGMIAIQALWAGPWLTRVAGRTPPEAAQGLLVINLSMLCAFAAWGFVMPRLAQRGIDAWRLVTWGVPASFAVLAIIITQGAAAGAAHWALWCVACTFVSASQPAIGAAFPATQAGRALSAFNLVIFAGVFCIQWGMGLGIDALRGFGLDEAVAYRCAFAVFGVFSLLSYAWFLRRRGLAAHNPT